MFLDTIPAQRACRMRLAGRQRIEGSETLESYARDDRFQTPGMDRIAAMDDGGGNPPEFAARMRLYGGELSRSPPYASILPLSRVKGPLRQALPALDPITALPRRGREGVV